MKQRNEEFLLLKPVLTQQINKEIQQKQHSADTALTLSLVAAVECKCVHGTCKPNESLCNKCYEGWVGVLCDLPKSRTTNPQHILEDENIFQTHRIPDVRANEEVKREAPRKTPASLKEVIKVIPNVETKWTTNIN